MKTKTCKQCGNEFRIYLRIDRQKLNLKDRSYCLDCSPMYEKRKNYEELKKQNKKQCSKCNLIKDLSEFTKHYKNSDEYRSNCTACLYLEKQKRRKKIQQELKSNLKCEYCGYDKCLAALHFHHLDPTQKDISIGDLINRESSKKRLEEELSKCIVLCANCHSELHWNERQNEVE